MIRGRTVEKLYFLPREAVDGYSINFDHSGRVSLPGGLLVDYDSRNERATVLAGKYAGYIAPYLRARAIRPISPLELLAEVAE